MLAVSFLGTRPYKKVTYNWGGQECTTDLFPEAVVRIFGLERLLVLVTEEVKRHENFRALQERVPDKLQPIGIPSGGGCRGTLSGLRPLCGSCSGGRRGPLGYHPRLPVAAAHRVRRGRLPASDQAGRHPAYRLQSL